MNAMQDCVIERAGAMAFEDRQRPMWPAPDRGGGGGGGGRPRLFLPLSSIHP